MYLKPSQFSLPVGRICRLSVRVTNGCDVKIKFIEYGTDLDVRIIPAQKLINDVLDGHGGNPLGAWT